MLSDSPDTFLPFWNNKNAFQYAKQSWMPENNSRYGRMAAIVYAE